MVYLMCKDFVNMTQETVVNRGPIKQAIHGVVVLADALKEAMIEVAALGLIRQSVYEGRYSASEAKRKLLTSGPEVKQLPASTRIS